MTNVINLCRFENVQKWKTSSFYNAAIGDAMQHTVVIHQMCGAELPLHRTNLLDFNKSRDGRVFSLTGQTVPTAQAEMKLESTHC